MYDMDNDQLDDLKQFIAAAISQSELRADKRFDGMDKRFDGMDKRFDKLERDMADGFAGVGEAIEEMNTRIDEQNSVVNARLTKLEKQVA